MSESQYVSLSSLFHTAVRSLASGTHDVLESIEMEDDVLERRRNLLKLLVWAQATLYNTLLTAQWCRKRLSFYKSAMASEVSLITYDSAWAMTASQISQHKTAMTYPVWDLHTSIHTNSLCGYYLLPRYCAGGVANPIPESSAKQCRRRLQCRILTSLLAAHPPLHVRIVRCNDGHVTLNSISGYTIELSLRMAPRNLKDSNETEQSRINWTLMSLQFNLTTDDKAFVISPRQATFILHNEGLYLMSSESLSSGFHKLIERIDRICCYTRFQVIKRQAQESSTQINRLQVSDTELIYWFWPNSAIRINYRQPTLRYLVITGNETSLLNVATCNVISFSSIVDLAISAESTRLVALARKHSHLAIDVDQNTGKLLVPYLISKNTFVSCNIETLVSVLQENKDHLELYKLNLSLRCSGIDIIFMDYSKNSLRIRSNGRYLDVMMKSYSCQVEINHVFDGSVLSHHVQSSDSMHAWCKDTLRKISSSLPSYIEIVHRH